MRLWRGDMAALSAHLWCLLAWFLYVLAPTAAASNDSTVPIIYLGYCTPDVYCDNRSEYCDDGPIKICMPCTDICGKNGVVTACQNRCQGYLQYNLQQEKEQELIKEMNKIIDSRTEHLLDRLAVDQADLGTLQYGQLRLLNQQSNQHREEEKLIKKMSENIDLLTWRLFHRLDAAQAELKELQAGHTNLLVIVVLGFLSGLVAIGILIKVVHRVHQPQGGPYRQTTPSAERTPSYSPVTDTELTQNAENESGLGTTNVTPENRRRSQPDIESGVRPQTFITDPKQDA